MGRSGGGGSRGGGGRSGGGRSGGSRSSGRSASSSRSSSGSSRSSFGGSSRSYSARPSGGAGGFSGGGFRSPRPTVRNTNVFVNTGGRYSSGSSTASTNSTGSQTISGSTGKRSSGWGTTILIIIVCVIMFMLIFGGLGGGSGSGSSYGSITNSTIDRDKLQLNLSDEAGYYTDECDWIRNRTVLENGLQDFYDSTGILPYVYIIDNVAGDYNPSTEKLEQFAEVSYEELFDDEGHILLVFWDYDGAYEYTLWLGAEAAKLMDTEACDILFDYLDYYYYEAETEDAFFADAFADAGEHMMSITRSSGFYVGILVAAGGAAFVVYWIWKSRRDKEAARKKRAEEILNTPLQKFSDDGDKIDELAKKYEKEI